MREMGQNPRRTKKHLSQGPTAMDIGSLGAGKGDQRWNALSIWFVFTGFSCAALAYTAGGRAGCGTPTAARSELLRLDAQHGGRPRHGLGGSSDPPAPAWPAKPAMLRK